MDTRTRSASVTDTAVAARGWPLAAHRAISLRPDEPSRLHITQGRVWVTLNAPHVAGGLDDHVLGAGQSLDVPAGAHVVMEPWAAPDALPVRFDWCVVPVPLRAPATHRFGREVVAPSREFVQALGQAGVALWRLVRGLLGYADHLVAGRGRVLTPWESNPP